MNSMNPKSYWQVVVLMALVCLLAGGAATAQDTNSAAGQRRFDSPAEAVATLRQAAEAGDRHLVHQIFGPSVKDFLTGDPVQDEADFKKFARAMAAGCEPTPVSSNELVLNIGTNAWPFPVPLVRQDGQWFFDTDAGREEIIDRHIGRDELNAIGICRALVRAQREYHRETHGGGGRHDYALKFKSTSGREDGLYWDPTNGPSPLAAIVAQAHAEGYGNHPSGTGPHPFHGYLFRILTAQGRAAPGGRSDYLVSGQLTGGFGLVAYPAKWGHSGIMTFIVNQDGKVYQRNLGKKTEEIASRMTEYNPGRHWTLVNDPGVEEP